MALKEEEIEFTQNLRELRQMTEQVGQNLNHYHEQDL